MKNLSFEFYSSHILLNLSSLTKCVRITDRIFLNKSQHIRNLITYICLDREKTTFTPLLSSALDDTSKRIYTDLPQLYKIETIS